MVYISKVINTILTLTDKLSAPLKNTSKAVQIAKSKTDELKKAYDKLKGESNKAARAVENQKSKIEELTRTHGEESQEVVKAKAKLDSLIASYKEAKTAATAAGEAARKQAKAYKDLSKNVSASQNALSKFAKASTGAIDKAIVKVAKAGTTLAAAAGSFALGTGFTEAFNMEGYKMQLVTATKDTEKAGRLMANAVKFANSTPFETGEVVEATAKMEAYGLSSEKWLKDVADMAGATNKSIDQATEAMADAVMGEFERLKEFGIKKEEIIALATAKYGKAVVSGKKGEAAKRAAIEEALQEKMREKFEGGAEAQAKTFKGLWSTITGVTKSALGKIVGMNEDGTIRTGSLYDQLKNKMQQAVDVLNKWMEDGTIDKIASQVTIAINSMVDGFSRLSSFIEKYWDYIKLFLVFATTMYTVAKAVEFYKMALVATKFAMDLMKGPMFWVVTAISVLVTWAYKLGILDDIFKGLIGAVKTFLGIIKEILNPIGTIFEKGKKLFSRFFKEDEKKEEKETSKKVPEKTKPKLKTTVPEVTPANTGVLPAYNTNNQNNVVKNVETKKIQERTVIKESSKPQITVNITGDVYGFEDFKEKVAEAMAKIYQEKKSNVVGV